MIYLYSNTFSDLLNLINYILKNKISPINIKNEYYSKTLLEETYYPKIQNDDDLERRIINKIGKYAFATMCHVFLSDYVDKEMIIYLFLKNALIYKNNICYMRNIPSVSKALKISSYVRREAHKFKGFVRFKELDNGFLYSEIEPENNIIYMLCDHFKNRLKNEYWIIKDNKREILGLYDKKRCYIFSSCNFDAKLAHDNYEDLWKEFYKTIDIKERKNDRCRMNFMPKKYWKYIVEVEDEKSNK